MAIGAFITAARYNSIQAKVGNVLGNGVGQTGYGQVSRLKSSQVPVSKLITSFDMENLRDDIIKAHAHQTGTLPTLPVTAISDDVGDAEYVVYEAAATTVLANKSLIDVASQASVESKISSSRAAVWGGTSQQPSLVHQVSVTFGSVDQRRHFFNAGGEIRFSANIVSGSGTKTSNWASMLNDMSTIKFNYNSTSAQSGTGSSIGNFALNGTFQNIYNKFGTSIYSDNQYSITARGDQSSNVITFNITFFDGTSNVVDESVNGTITSTVSQLRPTGIYVEVPTPVYQNLNVLS